MWQFLQSERSDCPLIRIERIHFILLIFTRVIMFRELNASFCKNHQNQSLKVKSHWQSQKIKISKSQNQSVKVLNLKSSLIVEIQKSKSQSQSPKILSSNPTQIVSSGVLTHPFLGSVRGREFLAMLIGTLVSDVTGTNLIFLSRSSKYQSLHVGGLQSGEVEKKSLAEQYIVAPFLVKFSRYMVRIYSTGAPGVWAWHFSTVTFLKIWFEFFGPIHIGSLKNVDFQYFSVISQHSSCLFLHQLKWERLNTFCQKLKFQVFSTPISSGILVSKFCISLHACKFVCLLCLLIFFCCVDCRFFWPGLKSLPIPL